MTPSSAPNRTDTGHMPSKGATVTNWALALATIPAAVALALFAYAKVLGSAGCASGSSCPTGPADLTFTLATYGAPIVALLAVAVSFVTARRPRGIAIPLVAWLILLALVAGLLLTFT